MTGTVLMLTSCGSDGGTASTESTDSAAEPTADPYCTVAEELDVADFEDDVVTGADRHLTGDFEFALVDITGDGEDELLVRAVGNHISATQAFAAGEDGDELRVVEGLGRDPPGERRGVMHDGVDDSQHGRGSHEGRRPLAGPVRREGARGPLGGRCLGVPAHGDEYAPRTRVPAGGPLPVALTMCANDPTRTTRVFPTRMCRSPRGRDRARGGEWMP